MLGLLQWKLCKIMCTWIHYAEKVMFDLFRQISVKVYHITIRFDVIKTCWKNKRFWNQVKWNNSCLKLLPGGWWLRNDWRTREAWTHKNDASVFLFDIVPICAFEPKLAASKMNHKFKISQLFWRPQISLASRTQWVMNCKAFTLNTWNLHK